uniref:HAT C-terminal dimerisation domain-containing protein n=1 Tax=Spongospora subterranea TaxID=70186 RepID=A0A0H5RC37_9EUKA|eukprot:CRZ11311.1 hypothetical protein [Spongospora subterranea]
MLDNIRSIMISLRTIKNRAFLRKKTHLSPILDNATRWSFKYAMLKRYSLLMNYIENIVPIDLQLSPRQNAELDILLKKLGQLEQLTLFLHSEKRHMHEVRMSMDKAIELFESSEEHCSAHSAIVCDPTFESAICKIQHSQILNEPLKLTAAEARSVDHLKVQERRDSSSNQNVIDDDGHDEMAVILQSIKRPKVNLQSRYMDCRFIRPTSNICERFFSLSKMTITDSRSRLLPSSLEIQLFLKFNGSLWDIELFYSEME